MKICLINNLYKPYSRGGAEKVVEMTAKELQEMGHEVFVITADPHLNPPPVKQGEEGGGLRIYRVYSPNLIFYGNLGKLPMPFRLIWHFLDMFNFVAAWKVRQIIQNEKPDIIFLHNLKGLSYLIPKFLRNENLVLIPHDVQLAVPSGLAPMNYELRIKNYGFLINWYGRINQFLFGDIKKVIFPSKWLLDFYTEGGFFKKAKKVVLHNPTLSFLPHLDPPPLLQRRIRLGRKRGGGEGGVSNLLFVGQLEKSKGILFLIDILKNLALRQDSGVKFFRLTIVGEGSKRGEIEKLIIGDERFKYLGKLDGDDLQKTYEEADYTIVPSLIQENCPTVILESIARGTPVIASRVGGIPELVLAEDVVQISADRTKSVISSFDMPRQQNGFLFNPGDAKDLERILQDLSKMDWLKLSQKARASAKIHAIDRYIDLLINFSYKEDGQNALEREPCQMCQQRLRKDDHEEI